MIRRVSDCLILIHQQVKLIYTKGCIWDGERTTCVVMSTRRENLCYEANRLIRGG